jgi:hypothetical protein
MIDYAAILSRKYSESEWSLNGDEYSGLIGIAIPYNHLKQHLIICGRLFKKKLPQKK